MRGDRYSKMVAWLKVSLPLMALALLSTLFLISRAVVPTATIPFADSEVQERLNNQQVTGPYFSGTSARGDQIAFIAEKLTTPSGEIGANRAEDVTVNVNLATGSLIQIEADAASIDIVKDMSELVGAVKITTSDGYIINADRLDIRLSQLEVNSPQPIDAVTPVGDLSAGAMRFFDPQDGTGMQLVFTNGVKLLYKSQQVKD